MCFCSVYVYVASSYTGTIRMAADSKMFVITSQAARYFLHLFDSIQGEGERDNIGQMSRPRF